MDTANGDAAQRRHEAEDEFKWLHMMTKVYISRRNPTRQKPDFLLYANYLAMDRGGDGVACRETVQSG